MSEDPWRSCGVVAAATAPPAAAATTSRRSTSPTRATRRRAPNLDEAISKYEQATKLDPTNHRIWWKLALAYQKKEDWEKVATACSHAEEAAEKADGKKTHADYYFHQGYALEQLAEKGAGSWADAKAPFQTAIQLDPELRRRVRRARRGAPPPRRRGRGAPELDEGDRDEARPDPVLRRRSPTSTAG